MGRRQNSPDDYLRERTLLAYEKRPGMESRCLEWTEALDAGGYGKGKYKGDMVSAHRLAWRLWHGPIPRGVVVCHRCDNTRCCRVDHLFLGTRAENSQDMVRKGRARKARLSPEQRAAIQADTRSTYEIAQDYGIAPLTAYKIRREAVIPRPEKADDN